MHFPEPVSQKTKWIGLQWGPGSLTFSNPHSHLWGCLPPEVSFSCIIYKMKAWSISDSPVGKRSSEGCQEILPEIVDEEHCKGVTRVSILVETLAADNCFCFRLCFLASFWMKQTSWEETCAPTLAQTYGRPLISQWGTLPPGIMWLGSLVK